MASSKHSSLMPWLIFGVVAFIIFGSLYPFTLNGQQPGMVEALHRLSWAHAGRDDLVRNVLMYLPLGFCLVLWLQRSSSKWWALLLACVAGAALSFSIEVAQVYFPRVPSYMDMLLNTSGTLLGAIVGLSWASMSQRMVLPDNVHSQSRDRNALLLVLLWIIWRLADISFHVSLARLKMAINPLLHIEAYWLLVLRYLILWLTVSLAVLAYASRQRANEAVLAVIGILLVGRILFVSPAFDSSELLALILLLPTLVMIHALHRVPATALVLLATIVLYVNDHVLPVNFGAFHPDFNFVPFVTWIRSGSPLDLNALLHMLFVYTAMIWLLKASTLSLRSSVFVVVAALSGIEILHLWQISRSGSITRPLVALCAGLIMLAIDRQQKSDT